MLFQVLRENKSASGNGSLGGIVLAFCNRFRSTGREGSSVADFYYSGPRRLNSSNNHQRCFPVGQYVLKPGSLGIDDQFSCGGGRRYIWRTFLWLIDLRRKEK